METPLDTMKHIESQALTISDNFNDQATYFPTRVLPKDMGLHSLEEHMEFRNHYRAKMLTNSVPDFVNYFTTNNGENCFIDAEEMRAKTIFDIGTIEEPKQEGRGKPRMPLQDKIFCCIMKVYSQLSSRRSQCLYHQALQRHQISPGAYSSGDRQHHAV